MIRLPNTIQQLRTLNWTIHLQINLIQNIINQSISNQLRQKISYLTNTNLKILISSFSNLLNQKRLPLRLIHFLLFLRLFLLTLLILILTLIRFSKNTSHLISKGLLHRLLVLLIWIFDLLVWPSVSTGNISRIFSKNNISLTIYKLIHKNRTTILRLIYSL